MSFFPQVKIFGVMAAMLFALAVVHGDDDNSADTNISAIVAAKYNNAQITIPLSFDPGAAWDKFVAPWMTPWSPARQTTVNINIPVILKQNPSYPNVLMDWLPNHEIRCDIEFVNGRKKETGVLKLTGERSLINPNGTFRMDCDAKIEVGNLSLAFYLMCRGNAIYQNDQLILKLTSVNMFSRDVFLVAPKKGILQSCGFNIFRKHPPMEYEDYIISVNNINNDKFRPVHTINTITVTRKSTKFSRTYLWHTNSDDAKLLPACMWVKLDKDFLLSSNKDYYTMLFPLADTGEFDMTNIPIVYEMPFPHDKPYIPAYKFGELKHNYVMARLFQELHYTSAKLQYTILTMDNKEFQLYALTDKSLIVITSGEEIAPLICMTYNLTPAQVNAVRQCIDKYDFSDEQIRNAATAVDAILYQWNQVGASRYYLVAKKTKVISMLKEIKTVVKNVDYIIGK